MADLDEDFTGLTAAYYSYLQIFESLLDETMPYDGFGAFMSFREIDEFKTRHNYTGYLCYWAGCI
jgi:hypothetical protein